MFTFQITMFTFTTRSAITFTNIQKWKYIKIIVDVVVKPSKHTYVYTVIS